MANGKSGSEATAAAGAGSRSPPGKQANKMSEEKAAAENPGYAAAAEEEVFRVGKVKWFSPMRGFGFITPDDGSPDIFVHQTSIHAEGFRSLREGEVVEYVVQMGDDSRMRAANVTGPKGAFVEGAPRDEIDESMMGNSYNNGGGGGGGGRGRGRGRMGMGPMPSRGGGAAGFGYGGGRCFNCNEPGHVARECTMARAGCYSCGKQGHFARDCPSQS